MKRILFSVSLLLSSLSLAASPSWTCSVSKTIPTGEKPIFETVVQPFTVYPARPGETHDASSSLKVNCQAVVALGGDAGHVECEFHRGDFYPTYLRLASASALAIPEADGFKGYLRLEVVDHDAANEADRGDYSLSCRQN